MRLVARTGGAVAALSLGLAVVPAVPAHAAVVHVGCDVEELRDAITRHFTTPPGPRHTAVGAEPVLDPEVCPEGPQA